MKPTRREALGALVFGAVFPTLEPQPLTIHVEGSLLLGLTLDTLPAYIRCRVDRSKFIAFESKDLAWMGEGK